MLTSLIAQVPKWRSRSSTRKIWRIGAPLNGWRLSGKRTGWPPANPGSDAVAERFEEFAQQELPSFAAGNWARRLYTGDGPPKTRNGHRRGLSGPPIHIDGHAREHSFHACGQTFGAHIRVHRHQPGDGFLPVDRTQNNLVVQPRVRTSPLPWPSQGRRRCSRCTTLRRSPAREILDPSKRRR